MTKKTVKSSVPAKKKTLPPAERLPYRRVDDGGEEFRQTTFDLPRSIITRLGREAADQGTSKGQVLRKILDSALPPL